MKGEKFNNNENSYEELNDNVNINDYRNYGRIQIMFGENVEKENWAEYNKSAHDKMKKIKSWILWRYRTLSKYTY